MGRRQPVFGHILAGDEDRLYSNTQTISPRPVRKASSTNGHRRSEHPVIRKPDDGASYRKKFGMKHFAQTTEQFLNLSEIQQQQAIETISRKNDFSCDVQSANSILSH
ncbi:hypothetical protein RvY_18082-5 [Ramazzottius varieornatus]|uniref:Uncharacterized protein n=1 Tax=Ramazzottius varieornatus TaxID=947166 RepID=A0A1D1W4G6_RAMVA|nr:hypothetical protein RvY_18082-5 [Ramazzottius varieornatus]